MGNLVLPQKITVQLTDSSGKALEVSNILFTVHLFATHKNDFHLGPYISDKSGKVTIMWRDLDNDIQATYDSGLMDYAPVDTCHSFVEILPMHSDDIERALHARENVWVILLKGEKERWGSLKNLLKAYRQAKNNEFKISKELSRIQGEWNGEKDEYVYNIAINKK